MLLYFNFCFLWFILLNCCFILVVCFKFIVLANSSAVRNIKAFFGINVLGFESSVFATNKG